MVLLSLNILNLKIPQKCLCETVKKKTLYHHLAVLHLLGLNFIVLSGDIL